MARHHDRVANQADRPETVEVQQPLCPDPVADVPVSTQRQAPTIQTEQRTVEFPQFLHFDRVQLWQLCCNAEVGGTAMCEYRRASDYGRESQQLCRSLHMNMIKDGSWNRVCMSSCLRLWRDSRQLSRSLHVHKDRRCIMLPRQERTIQAVQKSVNAPAHS